jgi:hypothetical protein
MENKPVFESFDEFVQFVYEAKIFEDNKGYVGSLTDILSGGMKLGGDNKATAVKVVTEYLNKYYADGVKLGKEMGATLITDLKDAFDTLNNDKIATTGGLVRKFPMNAEYEYLQAGTVLVDGLPSESGDQNGGFNKGAERLPLAEVLARLNFQNFLAFTNSVEALKTRSNAADLANSGYEGQESWKRYQKNTRSNEK